MEHGPTSSTIFMNIGVQALNLLLFFLIFYFGFAKKISEGLQDRKDLIAKLQYAEEEYKSIVGNAESAAKEIIGNAQQSKKTIMDEAAILAKQKSDDILTDAAHRADSIIQNANVSAMSMESELKDNYETLVKTTAGSYLKKIFDTEPDMQNAYMEKVVKGVL